MTAVPTPQKPELAPDPTSGDEVGEAIRDEQAALRAEEIRLLRRKMDGVVVFAAGPANVAMQLAWPEVGYALVESKVESGSVMKHPFKRFRTTIGYLGVTLLGSHELRNAFREAINAQHRQVRSTAQSPVKYNAFNRDLQLWVASCIYYGFVDTITRMHGPMTREEQEVLLRAGARIGTTLQVPADKWHHSPDDFWAYWEAGLQRCEIDDRVGGYLNDLLRLAMVPAPLRWVFGRPTRWTNTGFLPEPIRDQLGLTWTERDQRRHDRLIRVTGRISSLFPHLLRAFPVNAMVWNLDLRRRLGRPLA
jgi:uncharacterized protein (DUF2236 family)